MAPTGHSPYPLNSSTGKWTMISTITASSIAFIDATALNVILPALQKDLNASGSDLFWILNSYLLMLAAFIIVGGSLGDKRGRVKVFMLGIFVFTIGSVACGMAQSTQMLIAFRGVQGLGGALMIPGSLSIISAAFSEEEKGKAIGTWSAATTVVTVCGPVLGGALADIGLWRLIFFVNLPLGAFALWVLQVKVPESREEGSSSIDWAGAILLVGGLFAITFGFLEMPEIGHTHPLVIGSLVVGVLLLILFVVVENKVKDPMLPFTLFANRTFSGVNLLSFFLYAALGGMMLFLSLNIIQVQGYSQLQAGLTFLPFSFVMIVMARKMGSLSDKYGPRRFLIVGPFLAGLGIYLSALVGLTDGPEDYWVTYFPYMLIFALGMAVTVVPLTAAVMSSAPPSKSGIASGVNNSVTRIAGTFMNAVLGAAAIYLFANYVGESIQAIPLSEIQKEAIMLETTQLGEAQAPSILSPDLSLVIDDRYDQSFIKTYRWVGILSAVLAFISSLIAFLMVRDRDCLSTSNERAA